MLSLNTFASASAAAWRRAPSGCMRKFKVGSSGSGAGSPFTSKRSADMVSSNSRFQAPRAVSDFSWNSRSSFSSS